MQGLRSVVVVVALAASVVVAQDPAPRVARLVPEHGAIDVDPALRELTVAFDRDMDTSRGWSLCGGGPNFPTVRSFAWRDARTLVVTVELRAGQRYETELNCATSAQRFRDTEGRVLAPLPWSFTTSGSPAPVVPLTREQNAAAVDELLRLVTVEYSHSDRVVDDWPARFAAQRDALLDASDKQVFAARAATLLGAAQDPHLWLICDGVQIQTHRRNVVPNLSRKGLERAIEGLVVANVVVLHATLEAGDARVGYLAVLGLQRNHRRELEAAHGALRGMKDRDAIVLDLRGNGGGDESLGMALARWFVDGEGVYAKSVLRDPKTGAWDVIAERRIAANTNGDRFTGMLVVLQGPVCMSSCEGLLMMLKRCPRAVFVGETSGGSSGNPKPHELGNGVVAFVPSWRALDANDQPIEGIGLAPDVAVEVTPKDFESGDPVLTRALELVRER